MSWTTRPFGESVPKILMRKVTELSLIFEVVKRVKLGEEHRWTASTDGDQDFQWKKQNKKKELGREGSKRKRSKDGESKGDTFLLASAQASQKQPEPLHVFVVDSDEEDCEVVEDSRVSGSPEAFPELFFVSP